MTHKHRLIAGSALIAVGLGMAVASASNGPMLHPGKTLYSFTGGTDGFRPNDDALAQDAQGNLYGTTRLGGAFRSGTVFEVSSAGIETVLYSFTGGSDGGAPLGGLIRDAQGNLYGTTSTGGAHKKGTVFKITPSGAETVLYSFKGGSDGKTPVASLIADAQGNLYGTTVVGGLLASRACGTKGCGTVFSLSATGKEKALHRFAGGADGTNPLGRLLLDSNGNLYGTTSANGGQYGWGTVFKVTQAGVETVLYSFTGSDTGVVPTGNLVLDSQGNLYGTTYYGGNCGFNSGCGTVFELSPSGVETVLHSFAGHSDGQGPGSLIQDANGNLYGVTQDGGPSDFGTLYKVVP